jgi:hypothetical protein
LVELLGLPDPRESGVGCRGEGLPAPLAAKALQPGAGLSPALDLDIAAVEADVDRLLSLVDLRQNLDPRVERGNAPAGAASPR